MQFRHDGGIISLETKFVLAPEQKQCWDLNLTFGADGAFNFIGLFAKQCNFGIAVKGNLLDVGYVNR